MKAEKCRKEYVICMLVTLMIITSSCEKLFNGNNPVQSNKTVKECLKLSGVVTYDGDDPPDLTNSYTTEKMKNTNSSSKLSFIINQYMNSVFKLYDQTSDGNISFSEQISGGLWADGKGAYITGSDQNFTIWMENTLSNGAATAFVLSGNLDSGTGNLINCKSLTVYTKASSSYSAGDWYSASGSILKISKLVGKWSQYVPMDPGTHRGDWTRYLEFNSDNTCKYYISLSPQNYWYGKFSASNTLASVNLKYNIGNVPLVDEFDFKCTDYQLVIKNGNSFTGTWSRK